MNENMISVSQFSNYIKQIFNAEELLHNICVYGEVSGFNISRGTAYFNLKDEQALLPCVCFNISELTYVPNEGDMIMVRGSPNYYVKGGRFSFVVNYIQAYGVGILYQRFIELKNKLEKEGLFDGGKKKPLPKHIKRVGVVTSQTGAVIQDIIDITRRRNPLIDIVLYPAKVQGVGAEATIVHGIKTLDETDVDVIIVARGGGSLEDLNPFNTEIVAKAIADANKMVISAVGHETDFTIADFVADMRAPTPSAAAELISVDLVQLTERLNQAVSKINNFCINYVYENTDYITGLINDITKAHKASLNSKQIPVKETLIKLDHIVNSVIKDKMQSLELITNKIKLKNPMEILQMGYATIEKGNIRVRDINDVMIGDVINLNLNGGVVVSEVKDIVKGERYDI